ncbi:leucyl aminopeptidase family protein [Zavarzinia sp. CC-PAN008]|uniref:leucyl aminopeptidase family protein n=1 Tax=Zavarzinia sp. CC-PAN008 TaxID=3243332 RepID=UPI003F745B21
MTELPFAEDGATSRPLWLVRPGEMEAWIASQPPAIARWVADATFKGEAARLLLLPGEGGVSGAVLGLGGPLDEERWILGGAATALPPGAWALETPLDAEAATRAAIGFALGAYRFDRYREPRTAREKTLLVPPATADMPLVRRTVESVALVRDLVNTPSSDLGPVELAEAAAQVADKYGASISQIVGEELNAQGYPMVYAVGRASARAPRLIDMRWGDEAAPKVTLVGKGVCFDTGGLNIKPGGAMALMKKDMGGAAHALGLARMIMDADLPVRLRVLIPAVENAISGNAMRPSDILSTRKGITVEVGDTDAEGRLILGDALAEADEEKPDLLLDFATLTGAARVALGPDLPALFTPDDALAAEALAQGERLRDPMWRLPLWRPYAKGLESRVADLSNISPGGFGGAITAALFMQRFVTETKAWAHLDLFAWNNAASPGRPIGGEAMTLRAFYALIAARFA